MVSPLRYGRRAHYRLSVDVVFIAQTHTTQLVFGVILVYSVLWHLQLQYLYVSTE